MVRINKYTICLKEQSTKEKGDQSWVFIGRTDVEAETPIFWPPDVKSWFIWKGPDVGKDWGDDWGWDGWMASPTQRTWVWVNSWSWWWTGRPGVLRFMGTQRVGHDWVTELNWYVSLHFQIPSDWRVVWLFQLISLMLTSGLDIQKKVPLTVPKDSW